MVPFPQMAKLRQLARAPVVDWAEFPDSSHMDAYVTDQATYWPALKRFVEAHAGSSTGGAAAGARGKAGGARGGASGGGGGFAGAGRGHVLGGGGGGTSRLLGGSGGGGGGGGADEAGGVAAAADARRDEL